MRIARAFALLQLLLGLCVVPSAKGQLSSLWEFVNSSGVNNNTLKNMTNGTVIAQSQGYVAAVVSTGQNVSNSSEPLRPPTTTAFVNITNGTRRMQNSTSGGDSGGLDPMWYYLIPIIVVVVAVSIGLGVYYGMRAKGYAKVKTSAPANGCEREYKVLRLNLVRHVNGSDMT